MAFKVKTHKRKGHKKAHAVRTHTRKGMRKRGHKKL